MLVVTIRRMPGLFLRMIDDRHLQNQCSLFYREGATPNKAITRHDIYLYHVYARAKSVVLEMPVLHRAATDVLQFARISAPRGPKAGISEVGQLRPERSTQAQRSSPLHKKSNNRNIYHDSRF